jgi:uncharacterized protein YndB with AHSA1/START domain
MAVTYPIIVGEGKITIRSPPPRVFEAILNPVDLAAWWSADAIVEAQEGGRYLTNPPEGRQEGFIIGLEAPRRITFTWPIAVDDAVVETTVTYELVPKGPATVVHVFHRSRVLLARDRRVNWTRALEALQAHLEAGADADQIESGQ